MLVRALLAVTAAACGAAPPVATTPPPAPIAAPPPAPALHLLTTDPDLSPPPSPKLIDVDWATVALPDDAAALALWQRIAPTGDDWERKLAEVPADSPAAHALAVALLRAGHFACGPVRAQTHNCSTVPADAAAPAPTAGLDDPCLRRLLALWAVDQLGDDDVRALRPELHALAALPPPESELVAAAIGLVPEADQDERLAMLAIAWQAGQHDVVEAKLAQLDVPHLILAATTVHVPLALSILSPVEQRAAFVHAITDDHMPTAGRVDAIVELSEAVTDLPGDLRAALVTATRSADCTVAARAARALDGHGDHRFVPRRPHGLSTAAQLERAVCVLASFEQAQQASEPSLWPSFLPRRGLERVTISYDPLPAVESSRGEVDVDGHGDPHANRAFTVEPSAEAVLPEVDDLVRAMASCTTDATSVTCTSPTRVFKLVIGREAGELVVRQLEIAEKPACQDTDVSP